MSFNPPPLSLLFGCDVFQSPDFHQKHKLNRCSGRNSSETECFGIDACHPNDIGYRVIARVLCSKILGEKYKGISPDIDTEEDGADESMKSRLEVALEKDRKQLGYDYRAP